MKKNAKKLLPIALTLALTLGVLSGCSSNNEETTDSSNTSSDSSTADTTDSKSYSIGIIQAMEHSALDAAYQGFVEALAENGYTEGDNITLDMQNAQGDTSNLSTISDRFVSNDVDLILAIATPAAQAIAGKTTDIPIVATAVTSYEESGLVSDETKPGGNLTGTSDMNPVAAQIDLLCEMFPDAKTIGVLYNSSEANSVIQIDLAKEQIAANGLECEEATVTNTNDVQQAMQSLVDKCDAIYIPTDNTVASSMPTVRGVTAESKTPTMCGTSTMVDDGGLVSMGINYSDLGYKTGLMAVQILEGTNPGDLPIEFADSSDEIMINAEVAAEIGYEIPEKYQDAVIDTTENE
ncbi:MAG: ABC transporter substrate-binding protein [Sporomusa sp.]